MAEATPAAPGKIFMSYRRDETDFPAGWLYERLTAHFGREQVFKDVDSIELGDDFAQVIATAVGACDVLLALIGPQWLTITDEAGKRRLENPDDFVRLEIEAALQRNVRVIPILVGNARMPRADQVPISLAKLVRRQALELDPNRFEADTGRLVRVVDKTLSEAEARREAEQGAARAAQERERQEQARRAAEDRKLASVQALAASLGADDQAAVTAAVAALRPFVDDDSQRVSQAAKDVLAAWEVEQDERQAEADQRAAQERQREAQARREAEAQARREAEAEERERQEQARRAAEDRKLASVQALAASLGADDQAAVTAAVAALRPFVDDDSQRVSQAAKDVLAAWETEQRRRHGEPDQRAGGVAQEKAAAERVPSKKTPGDSKVVILREDEERQRQKHDRATEAEPARRRLLVAGGLAVAGAVLLVVSSFPTYLGTPDPNGPDLRGYVALSRLTMAALALGAGIFMLMPHARRLIGPGILLGSVAASGWGLLMSVITWLNLGRSVGAGLWLWLVAHLTLVLTTCLAGLTLVWAGEVHVVPRPPQGTPSWLVVLLGTASAGTFFFLRLSDQYPSWWYWIPIIWVTVMALVIPVCAVMTVPRQFGVALLAGWFWGGVALLISYVMLFGYTLLFGCVLLSFLLAAISFARTAPAIQAETTRPAHRFRQ